MKIHEILEAPHPAMRRAEDDPDQKIKRTNPDYLYHATSIEKINKILDSGVLKCNTKDSNELLRSFGDNWEQNAPKRKVELWYANEHVPPHLSASISRTDIYMGNVQFVLSVSALKSAGFEVEPYIHHMYREAGEEIIYKPGGGDIPVKFPYVAKIIWNNANIRPNNPNLLRLLEYAKENKIPVGTFKPPARDIRFNKLEDEHISGTIAQYMKKPTQLKIFANKLGSAAFAIDIKGMWNGETKYINVYHPKEKQGLLKIQDARDIVNAVKTNPAEWQKFQNYKQNQQTPSPFRHQIAGMPSKKIN